MKVIHKWDISNRELCQATGKITIFRNGKSDGFLWHSWLSWIQSKPLESGYMPGTIDEKIKDEDDDKSSLRMMINHHWWWLCWLSSRSSSQIIRGLVIYFWTMKFWMLVQFLLIVQLDGLYIVIWIYVLIIILVQHSLRCCRIWWAICQQNSDA